MNFKKFINPPYSKLLVLIAGICIGMTLHYPWKIDLVLLAVTIALILMSIKVESNEKIERELNEKTKEQN